MLYLQRGTLRTVDLTAGRESRQRDPAVLRRSTAQPAFPENIFHWSLVGRPGHPLGLVSARAAQTQHARIRVTRNAAFRIHVQLELAFRRRHVANEQMEG